MWERRLLAPVGDREAHIADGSPVIELAKRVKSEHVVLGLDLMPFLLGARRSITPS